MAKRFECHLCGKRPLGKDERVVSRFTGNAYCRDDAACQRRARRRARLAKKED